MATKSGEKKRSLAAYDDIFKTDEGRSEMQREHIVALPPEALRPFQNHPFHVQDDAELQKLVESIREHPDCENKACFICRTFAISNASLYNKK